MGHRGIPLLAAAFCIFSTSVSAATFNVTNGAEFESALATAQANGEADTINLAAGVYTSADGFTYTATSSENFPLTIAGAGPGMTVLDGQKLHRVLLIKTTDVLPNDAGADVALSGLTVQNGEVVAANESGAGIYVTGTDNDQSLANSLVQRNRLIPSSSNSGGAYLFTGSGNVTATDNIFAGNAAASVGGLRIRSDGGTIVATGNFFIGNDNFRFGFDGGGMGVDARDGDTTIQGNRFIRNTSIGNGGGLAVSQDGIGDVKVVNNIFFDNVSSASFTPGGGGGFAYRSFGIGELFFVHNTVYANRSLIGGSGDPNGGGIFVGIIEDDVETHIYNNIIYGNETDGEGQDIFADDDPDGNDDGAPLTLKGNDFGDFVTVCQENVSCLTDIDQLGHNIPSVNPLFVDPSHDDLHLSAFSPLIDQGNPDAPALPDVDFDGDPRVKGLAPDIGADEENVCGDGVQGAAEACDDGNTADGDGCSASCEDESAGSATPTPSPGGDDDDGTVDGGGCSLNPEGSRAMAGAWALFSILGFSALGLRRR